MQQLHIAASAAHAAGTDVETIRQRLRPAGVVQSAPGISFEVYSDSAVRWLWDRIERERSQP